MTRWFLRIFRPRRTRPARVAVVRITISGAQALGVGRITFIRRK